MPVLSSKTTRLIFITGAIVTWVTLILQFYLILFNRQASVAETIIRYFSFFTILSNILVALCLSSLAMQPGRGWGKFFTTSKSVTAIAVYITVVGVVYNTILRFLWKPSGLQFVVDELLHAVVPLYFLLCWTALAPKDGLRWKNVFPWLLYPFFYLLFVLVRGAMSGFYPYPFLDVTILGYQKVLFHCALLFFVFFLLSLIFVAVGKRLSARTSSTKINL
jgi:hypothetical protein